MKKLFSLILVPVLALALLPLPASAYHVTETMELITAGQSGLGGDQYSERPSISADGRFVVFRSNATDLIPGLTTNGQRNIYLHDRMDGTTKLITPGSSGQGGNNFSEGPEVSADGTKVVFLSYATDLIPGLTTYDGLNVFLYDVVTATTTLITPGSSGIGTQLSSSRDLSITSNGSRIAFQANATDLIPGFTTSNGYTNIFLYDVPTATTTLVTKGAFGIGGDYSSAAPTISPDGSKIVFQSGASDLIPGFTTNGHRNIFIYDVATDTISLITKGSSGSGGNVNGNGWTNATVISADNSLVAFMSESTDLIPGQTTLETNNVFLYNTLTEETILVSKPSSASGTTERSFSPSISLDGSTIGFASESTNLVSGITTTGFQNVFSYDVATGVMTLISGGPVGLGGDSYSYRPSLSADGRHFAFHSQATDLIPGLLASSNRQIYVYTRTSFCDFTFDPQNDSTPWTDLDVENCQATKPTDPTRSGFIFTGWFTAPIGGTLWNFNDRAQSDITLYAQWAVAPGAPNTSIDTTFSVSTFYIVILTIITASLWFMKRILIKGKGVK